MGDLSMSKCPKVLKAVVVEEAETKVAEEIEVAQVVVLVAVVAQEEKTVVVSPKAMQPTREKEEAIARKKAGSISHLALIVY